jgi:hypothetical protein
MGVSLISALVIIGGLGIDLKIKYDSLSTEYASLELQHSELQIQYETLNETHHALQYNHTLLQEEHIELTCNYSNLQANYQSMQSLYGRLQSEHSSLSQSYVQLERQYEVETVLRIGNSLESYYDLLRKEETPEWWWSCQQQADFCANLALHGLGLYWWSSIENDFLSRVGTHSYTLAKEITDEVIGYLGIHTWDTETNKIMKILDFIDEKLHYEYEVDNPYLAPAETLGLKSGDCDDFSILACALFEAVGIDTAFGIFKNEANEYHCMVLVHLEDLGSYGYWHYSNLTSYGLASGKWIIIEPQYTINHQYSDSISEWSLVAVSAVDT